MTTVPVTPPTTPVVPPVPGADGSPPGHLAAMEAKSATLNAPAPGTIPALPPEFLATFDAWKATQTPPVTPPVTPPDPNAPLTVPTTPPDTVADANKVVENAGLKMEDFSAEFAKDGKLSDASYEKLTKAGIGKDMVDGFIAGQQAIAERTRTDLLSTVGGEESFGKIAAWASANVPKGEIEGINRALGNADPVIQKLALQGLQARFVAANGSDPKLISGGANASAGTDTFGSRAQHVEAMKDPRYSKDPAYRTSVMDKAMRSTF